MREDGLQISIVTTLERTFPGLYFHHSPNGWFAGGNPGQAARQAAKLKAMGTRNGFPDLYFELPKMVEHGGELAFTGEYEPAYIELKLPGGTLTDAQKLFRDRCLERKIKWALCRSYEEVRNKLIEWLQTCIESVNSI